jgi:hypothetical protein
MKTLSRTAAYRELIASTKLMKQEAKIHGSKLRIEPASYSVIDHDNNISQWFSKFNDAYAYAASFDAEKHPHLFIERPIEELWVTEYIDGRSEEWGPTDIYEAVTYINKGAVKEAAPTHSIAGSPTVVKFI